MKKLKLAVFGAGGRVGNEIIKYVLSEKKFQLSVGVGRGTTGAFEAEFKSTEKINLSDIGVAIDFSSPELFREALRLCIQNEVPLVSGTTGLQKSDFLLLKKASKKIPVLWAANTSIGVATLKKSLEVFGSLKGFDIFIEEFHHNLKKDNPSGTALALQKRLNDLKIKTSSQPIGIRAGGIYGIHKVHAVSNEEHLVFEHQALNRAVFAKGALVAAEWLSEKSPGLYTIEDMLNV